MNIVKENVVEKDVVEVLFLYAPRVGHFVAKVSTDDGKMTQMSLEELKETYPLISKELSKQFNLITL